MEKARPVPQKPGRPRHQRKRRNNWENRQGKSRRTAGDSPSKKVPVVDSKPLCSVCQKVELPKYKCPKCRDTYCSIQCCRDHKEKGCSAKKETPDEANETITSKYLPKEELYTSKTAVADNNNHHTDEEVDDDLEPGWKITDEMKDAMQNSDWLRNELQDAGLRQIISSITATPNVAIRNQSRTKQEISLDKAKEDFPQFKRFIDKLLVTTGIMERHGPAAELDLEEWLKKEKDFPSSSLVLKGGKGRKPRIEKIDLKEETTESSSDEDDESSSEEEDDSGDGDSTSNDEDE